MNNSKDKTHNLERIYLNRESVDEMENMILIGRHLERYAFVRQYLWGNVVDIASGVGYGSHLIAKNPDISHVHGVDINEESVEWALTNFASERITFSLDSVERFSGKFDFLVSLETIEHLENPTSLYDLALRCEVKEIILSFPGKKTTHYNRYHKWDILPSDVSDLFKEFVCINSMTHYDSIFMHFIHHVQSRTLQKLWREASRN